MNNVIKFRVWDSIKGKMLTNAADIYLATNDDGIFEIEPKKSGLKIMPSTGLFDKNGNEIYEGDIMESEDKTTKMIVEFDGGEFTKRRIDDEFYCNLTDFKNDIIIGNIYENEGLLKS